MGQVSVGGGTSVLQDVKAGHTMADAGKKSRCSSASRRRCIEGNDCAQSNAEAYFGSLNARLTRGDPFRLGGGEP